MISEQETMKKAKRRLRKYRFWIVAVSVTVLLLFALITFMLSRDGIGFILLPFALLVLLFGSVICFNKCVLVLVTKEMDPDTFLKIFDIEKMDGASGTWQLLGEYYAGNYQNIISLCNLKMKNQKLAQKHQYMYMCYLANVYFDIGDYEKLKSILDKFNAQLAKEKPNRAATMRSSYPVMDFYTSYLGENTEACKNYLDRPIKDEVTKYRRKFFMAKLAYDDGDTEKARALYSEIKEKAPSINYGKLAATVLANMDNVGAEDTAAESAPSLLMEINSEDEGFGVLRIHHTSKRPIWIVIGILMAVFAVLGVVNMIAEGALQSQYEEQEDAKSEYLEDVRSLVAGLYDDVEVYDAINLYYETDMVDAIFVCKADDKIMVGISYIYGSTGRRGYREVASIPVKNLTISQSTVTYRTFFAETSEYEIHSCFCTSEKDIPKNYCDMIIFEVEGKTVYYVITDIQPLEVGLSEEV